jgi:hypothetical protein
MIENEQETSVDIAQKKVYKRPTHVGKICQGNEVSSHPGKNGYYKNMKDIKYWGRCGEEGATAHCWWKVSQDSH